MFYKLPIMALKHLLVFVISILSSVSFSQDYFSQNQSSQDSLRKAFNAFVKEVELHPIDTNHIAPKLMDNFQLVWVRHVSHSAPYYEKGDMSMLKIDSGKFQVINIDSYYSGVGFSSKIFYGNDYYVLWHDYNMNMSTIFNDVYYYKRKKIGGISDLVKRASCAHRSIGNSIFGDEKVFPTTIDSTVLLNYKFYVDSVSKLPKNKSVDTTAYYKLKYGYTDKNNFSAYIGTEDVECVLIGNDLVISYQELVRFINDSNSYSYGFGFPSTISIGDEILMYSGFYSGHGGTYDIESSYTYYFEKIE